MAYSKRMTDTGVVGGATSLGVYGPTEPDAENLTKQGLSNFFRLVYTAAGHEIGTAQARAALGWYPKLLSATVSRAV